METVVGNFRSRVRRHVDQLSPQPELIEPSIDVGDPLARAQAEYAECRKEARRAARALRAARISLVPVLVLLDNGRLRPHSTPVAYLLSAGESAEGLTGIPHFCRSVGVTTKGHLLTGLELHRRPHPGADQRGQSFRDRQLAGCNVDPGSYYLLNPDSIANPWLTAGDLRNDESVGPECWYLNRTDRLAAESWLDQLSRWTAQQLVDHQAPQG